MFRSAWHRRSGIVCSAVLCFAACATAGPFTTDRVSAHAVSFEVSGLPTRGGQAVLLVRAENKGPETLLSSAEVEVEVEGSRTLVGLFALSERVPAGGATDLRLVLPFAHRMLPPRVLAALDASRTIEAVARGVLHGTAAGAPVQIPFEIRRRVKPGEPARGPGR